MSASADAYNAITRLRDVFTAELKTEDLVIDPDLPSAVEVSDASFTWDTPPPEVETDKKARAKAKKAAKSNDTQDADAAREKPKRTILCGKPCGIPPSSCRPHGCR